jgi:hypothetical protein
MSPKGEDSSLPIHIGHTIIDGMMELKEEVGKLSGQIGGLQSSIGDLHGRIAQCMTRDECAAMHSGKRRTPSMEALQQERARKKAAGEWLDRAQKKVAITAGLLLIIGTLCTAFYWMSSAYSVIQKARVEIKASNGNRHDGGVKP